MSFRRTLQAAIISALVAIPVAYTLIDLQTQEAAKQDSLETLVGPLAEMVPQLKLETIQSACQITNERRTNEELREELRSKVFYTSDTLLYRREDGEVFLYFGNGIVNPVLKNLDVASKQVLVHGAYFPTQEEVEAVVSAKDTLKVKLSDLRLRAPWKDVIWSYLEIETTSYHELNKAERALAERVYCQGDDFEKNMEMLSDAGIRTAKIYVLKPREVYSRQARVSVFWNFPGNFRNDSAFSHSSPDYGLNPSDRLKRRAVYLTGLRGVRKN